VSVFFKGDLVLPLSFRESSHVSTRLLQNRLQKRLKGIWAYNNKREKKKVKYGGKGTRPRKFPPGFSGFWGGPVWPQGREGCLAAMENRRRMKGKRS